jgi:tRNA A-37 threonylcarbamoyl transferase component Bud32
MASADGAVVDTRLVAVKPFMLNEGSNLAQEVGMLQRARQQGLSTLTPLAIIADRWSEVPRYYLVTEHLDELSTLVAENWRGIQAGEVAERLQPAVQMMLALHEKGMVHGDPQFKNVATSEKEGKIIVHDMEEGTSIQDLLDKTGPDDPVPEQLVLSLRQEFYRVRLSMRDYVYPNLPADQRPNTPEERFMFELDTLFEQYHMALSQSDSPHRSVLDRTYKIVLERTRQEVSEGREPQPGDVPSSTART